MSTFQSESTQYANTYPALIALARHGANCLQRAASVSLQWCDAVNCSEHGCAASESCCWADERAKPGTVKGSLYDFGGRSVVDKGVDSGSRQSSAKWEMPTAVRV